MRLFVFILIAFVNPIYAQKSTHILFVGNSLTYTNNLPERVKSLAKESGVKLTVKMLALPNYALEDHWMDGELQNLIRTKKFAFVIVQQGPSSQPDGRAMLFDYGEKISRLCQENNSQLGFFMVWPARVNYFTFDGVIKNYSDAAAKTGALLFPVGDVWKKYFETTDDYSYYGADNFHPSAKGTEVAAKTIADILILELKRK